MSSSATGLGGWKKGGRVSDASAVTQNIRVVAQGQADATYAATQKKNPFRLSSAILNGEAYGGQTLSRSNLIGTHGIRDEIPRFADCVFVSTTDANVEPGTYVVLGSLGQYTAKASHIYYGTISQYGPQYAFQKSLQGQSGGWSSRTASNNYDGSTGAYLGATTTTVSGTSRAGEWLQITAPYAFLLNSYNLVTGGNGGLPTSWVLAGSTDDGTTFTTIDVQTNVAIVNNTITIPLPTNTESYSTYRIIVTQNATSTQTSAGFVSWNLFRYV